jgi:hypothetical protein
MNAHEQPPKDRDILTPDAPGSVRSSFSVPNSPNVAGQHESRITEQQASAILGVTVRTLRNYRRAGKLAYREVKGKTRPTIEYLKSDIERLKAKLTARRTRSLKLGPENTTASRVAFGLPRPELEELRRDAEISGLTVNEYARRLVRDRLESQYKIRCEELRSELKRCMSDVGKVRTEFAAGFEAVLEYVGVPAPDAKKWVNENLR